MFLFKFCIFFIALITRGNFVKYLSLAEYGFDTNNFEFVELKD